VTTQPLLRWRMAKAADESWGGMQSIAAQRPQFVASVLEEVRARGPLTAGEMEHERPKRAGPGGTGTTSSAPGVPVLGR
jgi:uncharacterized protein YcaQ